MVKLLKMSTFFHNVFYAILPFSTMFSMQFASLNPLIATFPLSSAISFNLGKSQLRNKEWVKSTQEILNQKILFFYPSKLKDFVDYNFKFDENGTKYC